MVSRARTPGAAPRADLSAGEASLVSLWGDEGRMRMALEGQANGALAVVDVSCEAGAFSCGRGASPSGEPARTVGLRSFRLRRDRSVRRPALARSRPVLDFVAPLGRAAYRATAPLPNPFAFRSAEGPGLHRIPVGPVHAGIIEPGHFRFHASGGGAVVRLEERLGYLHKGVEGLARGATVAEGGKT